MANEQNAIAFEPAVVAFRLGADQVYRTLPNHKEFGFSVCALCGMAYILLAEESPHGYSGDADIPRQGFLFERAVNASHADGHPFRLRYNGVGVIAA